MLLLETKILDGGFVYLPSRVGTKGKKEARRFVFPWFSGVIGPTFVSKSNKRLTVPKRLSLYLCSISTFSDDSLAER